MKRDIPPILFDRRDYDLLSLVDEVLDRTDSLQYVQDLLYPWLHPHGIKEIAASPALRMAYAALRLLGSLEAGKAEERITALRCLRDEVMSTGEVHMRRNSARVVLEIMKEMVRKPAGRLVQLKLAHDFRTAVIGRPRAIRSLLRRYHLLEMPEKWNQVSFDDHIHDSSTKGRKSPSHLIMDAWIKGIRRISVVYYNYVPPQAAEELLEAAEIMGVAVRIGIGFSAKFYRAYVQLIYSPAGLSDPKDFLSFLGDRQTKAFMEEGRLVSAHQGRYVLELLKEFNRNHLHRINERYGLKLDDLNLSDFLAYVGEGQPSVLHLAKFIHRNLLPAMREKAARLWSGFGAASREEREKIVALVQEMNGLDSEAIVDRFLRAEQNPGISDPRVPGDTGDIPGLLQLSAPQLVDRLNGLRAGCKITLNLTNLKAEDVLELLYRCKGAVSDLEIFNLKDFATGKAGNCRQINELQRAINDQNTIALKKLIVAMIGRMQGADGASPERIASFHEILRNIPTLQSYYRKGPLRSTIGSDSTGYSHRLHGMGLAILQTLPPGAQREVRRSTGPQRQIIPVRIDAFFQNTYMPERSTGNLFRLLFPLLARFPGLRLIGLKREEGWKVNELSTRIVSTGNVVTLGGINGQGGDLTDIFTTCVPPRRRIFSWNYCNNIFKNAIKITAGFIPAFLSFYLTRDWWVLAWLGAPIWFAITGVRNIIQSVFGAGGFRPSSLIKWDSYISWERISDSLFYTGLSVPLLDYLVKSVILDRSLGVNTSTRPVLLYTLIALANGLYIFGHNKLRGLPKGTATSNLFLRTILSIPLAYLMNLAAGGVIGALGVANVSLMLQKWAAIISKAASDCVAGVIEGVADRNEYIEIRANDYAGKLKQLFDAYAQLELLYPEADVLKMLESPGDFISRLGAEARDLEKIIIVNGLDLLYFWVYQPRARNEFRLLLEGMSPEEREILVRSQSVLRRKSEVSQLLANGMVGKKFEKALSFYLDSSEEYLNVIEKLKATINPRMDASTGGK
ncbi:MAG: hypothetical protein P4L43_07185 [Syntrophobacteraceae bacterium]|nr:hypothetical protein [Syntrophobacteraceae bacterium]